MAIWVIADLHLSFGVPEKSMEAFGPKWKDYTQKIEENWRKVVSPDDLVLIPGDISWAMRPEEALIDLEWIDKLPGTKVMIRGNHDYWWGSINKVRKLLPPSIHSIQNDVFNWQDVSIAGARLWDTDEYNFNSFIEFQENPKESKAEKKDGKKIFERELNRLELSLKQFNPQAKTKIAMTHYPPIGADLRPSRASSLLEEYGVSICVFGHLHNVKENSLPFGKKGNTSFILTSCDYLDFNLTKIL